MQVRFYTGNLQLHWRAERKYLYIPKQNLSTQKEQRKKPLLFSWTASTIQPWRTFTVANSMLLRKRLYSSSSSCNLDRVMLSLEPQQRHPPSTHIVSLLLLSDTRLYIPPCRIARLHTF
jgi:hypothetical protein